MLSTVARRFARPAASAGPRSRFFAAAAGAKKTAQHWTEPVVSGKVLDKDFDLAAWNVDLSDLTLEEMYTLGLHKDPIDEELKTRTSEMAVGKERVRGQLDAQGRAYGTGRRKASVARVYVQPCTVEGESQFTVNKMPLSEYFDLAHLRETALDPLGVTDTLGKYDVRCTVKGGGLSGQAGAIRLGLARALQIFDEEKFRPVLKEYGFLTRDPRVVERKKPGKKGARASFQWVKR